MEKEIDRATSLTTLIQNEGLKEIVEIGVAGGRLSRELLIRNQNIRLHLIDFWPPDYPLFHGGQFDLENRVGEDRAVKRRKQIIKLCAEYPKRTRLYEMPSLEAAALFADKSADIAFIDADHTYEGCKEDIIAWTPKVRAWLTGHDYSDRFPEVVRAVDEMAVTYGRDLQPMPGDVWAWRV